MNIQMNTKEEEGVLSRIKMGRFANYNISARTVDESFSEKANEGNLTNDGSWRRVSAFFVLQLMANQGFLLRFGDQCSACRVFQ